MVEFLIASTTCFEHLSKRNIELLQESEIIKFYERLYRAYEDVIDDQTFSPNCNLDQALKTRLIQFSTNSNYTYVRPYIGVNSEALRMTCLQLKNNIDRRQYTLKIGTPVSRISGIQKRVNEYVKYWIYWTLALFGILSFWTSKKICPNSPGSIVYGCLDGFNDVPEASGRLKQYFDKSLANGIADSVFFVFKGQKFFQRLNQTCSASRFPEALFISKSSRTLAAFTFLNSSRDSCISFVASSMAFSLAFCSSLVPILCRITAARLTLRSFAFFGWSDFLSLSTEACYSIRNAIRDWS